jgi:hypothetical protein
MIGSAIEKRRGWRGWEAGKRRAVAKLMSFFYVLALVWKSPRACK